MKFLAFLCMGAVIAFAKPMVTTSILPTAYFVKQIAGDTVSINIMAGAGVDPHTYEPKPRQMKNIEKSDIYFAVGADFESIWLPKFKLAYPKLVIVYTQKGIQLKPITHYYYLENKSHEEHGLDPHVWTDPVLVKIQAKNIADALISAYPNNKDIYEKNLHKFDKYLDDLNNYAKSKLSQVKNKNFIVYHPAWGYFAKQYGLKQIPIEIDGKDPKPANLKHLIDEAKKYKTKVIFTEPQFSKKATQTIAKEVGAAVVEINPLPKNWGKSTKELIDVLAKFL